MVRIGSQTWPAWARAGRPYVFGLSIVVGATLLGDVLQPALGSRNIALLFLIALAGIGAWLGMRPAIVSAFAAFGLYNFYLVEPRYELDITPADLLALITFLGAATFVGWISGRLSDKAKLAAAHLEAISALFEASRDLSAATTPQAVARVLARRVVGERGRCAVWTTEGGALALAYASALPDEIVLDWRERAAEARDADGRRQKIGGVEVVKLETDRGLVGVVALVRDHVESAFRTSDEAFETLMDLTSVAIERSRLMTEVAQAQLVAEREGLRTALLSSISHDLRTPLATILASATSLLDSGEKFDAATRTDLIRAIQEESDRLNRYVGHLLDMTRLESGALVVKWAQIDPSEAVEAAAQRMSRRLHDHRLEIVASSLDAAIEVDPVLLEQILVNIIDNAATYSPAGSAIRVGVSRQNADIVIFVEDDGPGIAPAELDKVFDKFFRGRSDRRRAAGVGLGLSIARGLTEAIGGVIGVQSPVRNGRGSRFELRFRARRALAPS